MEYIRPKTIEDAVSAIAAGGVDLLSGGTDYFPGLRDEPPSADILDLSAISALRGISLGPDEWRIGSMATWTDVIAADLPPAFDGLKAAAREVGSVQVQNRATLAGNLCNASPAADGVPPLLTLDAEVELISPRGPRRLALDAFITGNRRTELAPDELMTAILIPQGSGQGAASFIKLGARKYLVISIAMVAARLSVDNGQIADAAIAVGSCSEVATRLRELERVLTGCAVVDAATHVTAEALGALSPITDVRASDAYRCEAALELVRRAVARAAA